MGTLKRIYKAKPMVFTITVAFMFLALLTVFGSLLPARAQPPIPGGITATGYRSLQSTHASQTVESDN